MSTFIFGLFLFPLVKRTVLGTVAELAGLVLADQDYFVKTPTLGETIYASHFGGGGNAFVNCAFLLFMVLAPGVTIVASALLLFVP